MHSYRPPNRYVRISPKYPSIIFHSLTFLSLGCFWNRLSNFPVARLGCPPIPPVPLPISNILFLTLFRSSGDINQWNGHSFLLRLRFPRLLPVAAGSESVTSPSPKTTNKSYSISRIQMPPWK